MKKIAVVLVTIATLGIYTPTALLEVDAEESKNNFPSKAEVDDKGTQSVEAEQEITDTHDHSVDMVINQLTEKAKERTITKFGPRIASQVEDEFSEVILPNMEAVLQTIVKEHETAPIYFAITEEPSKGYGERIFNVYDNLNNEDVAKFHVRRDNRPLEGHYFNFHYHVNRDGFKEHYDLGEIYWAKDTPPKWMA